MKPTNGSTLSRGEELPATP